MARKPKTKDRLPPFAAIFNEEMLSKAYAELKPSAAKAYPHFKRFAGVLKKKFGYETPFDFTYSEAQKLGFARRTFSDIIEDLIAKGFIDITEQGGKRGCGFSNSKYKLSERWRNYGKPPIYDHMIRAYREPFIKMPRYQTEPDRLAA